MSFLVDIEKKLGNFHLKLRLEGETEILALLGASGCGKSLTLQCIAGIRRPDRGRIVLNGVTLFDSQKGIDLSPQKRRIGLLFQNYALFPHMTVLENLKAGVSGGKKDPRNEAVSFWMQRFGLEPLAQHLPHQLSGGQQQRVALGRLLVSQPELLLLDEPFSALDSHLRLQTERELLQLLREYGKPVLLVSHDRDEVYRMADRIAVLEEGRMVSLGEKHALFSHPSTVPAAQLLGCRNISPIERRCDGTLYASLWKLPLSGKEIPKNARSVGIFPGKLSSTGEENRFLFHVIQEVENPSSYTLLLENESGGRLEWELEKEARAQQPEDTLWLSLPEKHLIFLEDCPTERKEAL